MSDDEVKKSLSGLHDKQDQQTFKLLNLELSIAKQEMSIENYAKQSDRVFNELFKMNDNLAVYNAELQVHIAGVMELKEQNKLMREEIKQREYVIDKRLEMAEQPIKWAQTTAKYLKWFAGVIAAVASISALIAKLAGYL